MFVIIDVRPGVVEVPTTAYESVPEVSLVSRHFCCLFDEPPNDNLALLLLLFAW